MGVDWEYLKGVTGEPSEWSEAEMEELYHTLSGISKLRPRDKSEEKLELLFTLTQALMIAKNAQVLALEDKICHYAESSGRDDAHREKELLAEIRHLQKQVKQNDVQVADDDEVIAYDWSNAWKKQKKEMEKSLQQKNEEIQQFMDDLQRLEEDRSVLQNTVTELETKLCEAIRDLDCHTAEVTDLRDSHYHAQESLAKAREETYGLQIHNEELMSDKLLLQRKYDELSNEVDARVDQLQIIISQREEELLRLRAQTYQRSSNVPSSSRLTESDQGHFQHLEMAIKSRDAEIERLSCQLSDAAKEMEMSAQLISQLKKKKSSVHDGTVVSQLQSELQESKLFIQQLKNQLLAAEDDAQLHAQDLSTVIGELQSYMAGEFSLADAVRELKESRNQVRVRDSQLVQLTGLVNALQISVSDLLDENIQLRERLKLEPRRESLASGKSQWQQSKEVIDRLTKQVNLLQEEKTTLRTKVFELTRAVSNAQGSIQLTTLQVPRMGTQADQSLSLNHLEEQLQELSASVKQILIEKNYQEPKDVRERDECKELEESKNMCNRLEGEKAALERILKETRSQIIPVVAPSVESVDQLVSNLHNLPPNVEEVISKLKHQINLLFKDVDLKQRYIDELRNSSNIYTTKFTQLKVEVEQLNLVYDKDREMWASKKEALSTSSMGFEGEVKALKGQVEELKKIIDFDDAEDKDKKFANRNVELRYELEIAKRRWQIQEKDLDRLRNQLQEKINDVREKLIVIKQVENKCEVESGILRYRIASLERELNNSVPRTSADKTAAELANVTAKFRALLHDQSLLMHEKTRESELESEVEHLIKEQDKLHELLQSAREKVHSLQTSLALVGSNSAVNLQVELLARQIAAVELRELREKQNAEHAQVMYQNSKSECEELLKHVKQLQESERVSSQMNLTLQTKEAELIDQNLNSVSTNEYQKMREEIENLELEKANLTLEVKRLYGVLEVTEAQNSQKSYHYASNEAHLTQLQKQVHDLASIGNERFKIASLHQNVLHLRIRNLEMADALNESQNTSEKLRLQLSRTEQQLLQREKFLCSSTDANRMRSNRLYAILKDLRQQYVGAVPLPQQEHLSELMKELKNEQNDLQKALQHARQERGQAQLISKQLRLKVASVEELQKALSGSSFEKHLREWSQKLEAARLAHLEVFQNNESLQEELTWCRLRLSSKEQLLDELHGQLLKGETSWVQLQCEWEEREGELCQELEKYEKKQKEAMLDLKDFCAVETPDSSLPLSKQLEMVMGILGDKVNALERLVLQLQECQTECQHAQQGLREKEVMLLSKDQLINELQATVSRTSHLDAFKDPVVVTDLEKSSEEESIQVLVKGLQARLILQEEAVGHYQELLAQAHNEQTAKSSEHKEELIRVVEDRDRTRAQCMILQSQVEEFSGKKSQEITVVNRVEKIQSLEETIKGLERQVEKCTSELVTAHSNCLRMERELTLCARERGEEREQLEVSAQIREQQQRRETERLLQEVQSLKVERDEARKEVLILKEVSARTPSAIMRTLVEKLRDQLIDKEKQLANLAQEVQWMKQKIVEGEKDHEDLFQMKEYLQQSERETATLKRELEVTLEAKAELENELSRQKSRLNVVEEKEVDRESLLTQVHKLRLDHLNAEKQSLGWKRANAELREKLDSLEGRSVMAITQTITRLKEKLEKLEPSRSIVEMETRKAQCLEQVMRWEEGKKLRGIIEKLRGKVKDLEESSEGNNKRLETSRLLLTKIEKEKMDLQAKLNAAKSAVPPETLCSVCLKCVDTAISHNNRSANQSNRVRSLSLSRGVPASSDRSKDHSFKSPVQGHALGDTYTIRLSPSVSQQGSQVRGAAEQDESELRLRAHLKKTLDEKQRVERHLKSALDEVSAMKHKTQHDAEQLAQHRGAPVMGSGATLVLQYESRIGDLEEELRQKVRLLSHVKQVMREAADREETLLSEKESLLQRVTLLETVGEDTPTAHLLHELRHAKLAVTRLQRELDNLNVMR